MGHFNSSDAWPSASLLVLLEDPDLVPAVGQLEGAVVPGHVEGLVHELDAISLQALHKLQQLLTLHFLIGEAPVCPGEQGF